MMHAILAAAPAHATVLDKPYQQATTGSFGVVLDWTVIALYIVGLAFLGWWFGRSNVKNSDDYFLGGNRMPLWAVGISLLATAQSAATFLGAPGASYSGNLGFLTTTASTNVGILLVALLFIPVYYKMRVKTVYELMEYRFGMGARFAGSGLFLVGRSFASGARLFGVSLAVVILVKNGASPALWEIAVAAIVIGIIGTLYTLFGGIRSVIYTDVIQAVIYLGAAIIALVWIRTLIDANTEDIINTLMNKADVPDKENKLALTTTGGANPGWFNLANNYSPIALVIGWTLFSMGVYATDQNLAQRMLTCKNAVKGSMSVLFAVLIGLPVTFIFMVVGLLLYVLYNEPKLVGPLYEPIADIQDAKVFLTFIIQKMPGGLRGVMLAGLLAAGLSSFNSSVNAMSSSFNQDIWRRLKPDTDKDNAVKNKRALRDGRLGVCGAAVALVSASVLCALMYNSGTQTFITFALGVMVFAVGPLLGVYLAGLLKFRGNSVSVIAALCTSAFFVFYCQGYIQALFPASVEDGFLYYLSLKSFIPDSLGGGKISLPWIMTGATLISFLITMTQSRKKTTTS